MPIFFWIDPYYQITSKVLVEYLGLNWNIAEKILWFWPFIIISFFSSFYLVKKVIPNLKLWVLAPFIFLTNTYALMIVGGGQMGVAIAYSLAPLVLGMFIKHIDNLVLSSQNIKYQISNIKHFLVTGLVLALQMMFDPRITYITFIPIFLYFIFTFVFTDNKRKVILNSLILIVPLLFSVILNSFWIVSLLRYGLPPQDIAKMSALGFKFLSFADLSHTISMLHPNWPENIFGKVYFMKSEFVLLPVVAYSSLLFLRNKTLKNANQNAEKRRILFFALLGLVGTFLAKGSNPPFAFINEFFFSHFLGMSMFRDPTKFYLLIVLSYSILIPFSLEKISQVLVENRKFKIANFYFKFKIYYVLLLFTVYYLLFLIRPGMMGELGGTFKARDVPKEYIQLKDFLIKQNSPFKTLWFPERQRFGFRSTSHPAISSSDFFESSQGKDLLKEFENVDVREKLRKESVKYIIVPFDSEKEIFLEDRKYSEKKHTLTIKKLKSLSWLNEIASFNRVKVFEIIN